MKKDIWTIPIRATVRYKVAFSEPVTEQEALELYYSEDYEDVMDVDTIEEELLDWAE
jgi:hypothetical protein